MALRGGAGFHNYGLIQGEIALRFDVWAVGGGPLERTFNNEAGGILRGIVQMGSGSDFLQDAGLIEGAVNLGYGDDDYMETGEGRVIGQVSGGLGNDNLMGGASFDNFQGNQGDDVAQGGGGDDWVVGGKDNDLLFGEGGDDLVYGNLGNDTCDGGDDNDIVRGGQGDDVLRGGPGADFLSGDRDNDTITGGSGADIFHTFGEAGVDRVTDFRIGDGDRIQLDPGTIFSVAQIGADTVITMSGGGQMILVGVALASLPNGWIFGA